MGFQDLWVKMGVFRGKIREMVGLSCEYYKGKHICLFRLSCNLSAVSTTEIGSSFRGFPKSSAESERIPLRTVSTS